MSNDIEAQINKHPNINTWKFHEFEYHPYCKRDKFRYIIYINIKEMQIYINIKEMQMSKTLRLF